MSEKDRGDQSSPGAYGSLREQHLKKDETFIKLENDLIDWNDRNENEMAHVSLATAASIEQPEQPKVVNANNHKLFNEIDRNLLPPVEDLPTASNDVANSLQNSSVRPNAKGNGNYNVVNESHHGEIRALKNEQLQPSIGEFNRLGTYCTLRPEQRRKHLLKVLPILHNSNLLQTLLMQRSVEQDGIALTTPVGNRPRRDLGDFPNDLDQIMQCRLKTGEEQTIDQRIIDPENVDNDNCLLELDAYLKEIDTYIFAPYENGEIIVDGSPSSMNVDSMDTVNLISKTHDDGTVETMTHPDEMANGENSRHSSNFSDILRRVSYSDMNLYQNDDRGELLERGNKVRNTIGVFKDISSFSRSRAKVNGKNPFLGLFLIL